jgi:hypothetical protein
MKRDFMNRRRCGIVIALAAALAPLIAGVARANAAGGAHYYLALGDSLAASAQPNGDFQHGYAEQLNAKLQQQDASLQLVKLGCGGESTTSMIYGSRIPRSPPAPPRRVPHARSDKPAICGIYRFEKCIHRARTGKRKGSDERG